MTAASATPSTVATDGLGIAGLEAVYDRLAQAIDQAGEAQSERFLVKLALLQAQALGDASRFAQLVDIALQDL
jgi:hypothetical protein